MYIYQNCKSLTQFLLLRGYRVPVSAHGLPYTRDSVLLSFHLNSHLSGSRSCLQWGDSFHSLFNLPLISFQTWTLSVHLQNPTLAPHPPNRAWLFPLPVSRTPLLPLSSFQGLLIPSAISRACSQSPPQLCHDL